MDEVQNIAQGFSVSISTLHREFGLSRESVSRRLLAAGVEPSGTTRGHPVYRLGPAARALLAADLPVGAAGGMGDPDKLPPTERKAWYQSERDRLVVERESGELVKVEDCRAELATVIRITVQALEVLPDILERDCGLSSVELDAVEKVIRVARAQWAGDLEQG